MFGVAVTLVGCPRQGWGMRGCRCGPHRPCPAGSGRWVPWQLAVEVSSELGLDGLGRGECGRLGTRKAGAAPRWTQEKSQAPSRGGLACPSPVDAALAAERDQLLRLASASPLLEPLREKGKPDRGPCSRGRPKDPPETHTRGDRPPKRHSSNGNWHSLPKPTAPAPALPARGQLSPAAPAVVFSRIGSVWGFLGVSQAQRSAGSPPCLLVPQSQNGGVPSVALATILIAPSGSGHPGPCSRDALTPSHLGPALLAQTILYGLKG